MWVMLRSNGRGGPFRDSDVLDIEIRGRFGKQIALFDRDVHRGEFSIWLENLTEYAAAERMYLAQVEEEGQHVWATLWVYASPESAYPWNPNHQTFIVHLHIDKED